MSAAPALRPTVILGLAVGLLPQTGCLSVLKLGIQEVRGASADVLTVVDLPDGALALYRGLEFEPATTTAGPVICPPALLSAYDRAAAETRRELARVFPGGEPSLRVAGEILYFQKKGLLSAAQCLTRLKILGGGELLADAIVRAESKAFREGDEEALAEASLKAVRRFLLRKHRGEVGWD